MMSLSEQALGLLGFDAAFIEAVLGDLAEESATRAVRDGIICARLWYTRELLRSAPHLISAVIRRGGRGARLVVAAFVAAIMLTVSATAAFVLLRDGPPVRLVADLADEADVILLNQSRPVKLPMRVLDARGHRLESDSVRYTWQAGAPISITSTGVIKCTEPGDAVVHASLGRMVQQLAIHCRPVKEVLTSSTIDLIEGGDARQVPFYAVGMDDQPVTESRGVLRVQDTSIAMLSGITLRPRRPGSTTIEIVVGDQRVTTQVIVHQRVRSLAGLRPDQRFVAVPVRLAQGDTLHWPLPRGTFWLKYISLRPGEAPPTIELHGPASCSPPGAGFRVYRLPPDVFGNYCSAGEGATVEIAHGRRGAAIVEGYVALGRVY
jgi:hypothetical protein